GAGGTGALGQVRVDSVAGLTSWQPSTSYSLGTFRKELVSSGIPTPAILNTDSPQADDLLAWYPTVNAVITGSPVCPDLSGNGYSLTVFQPNGVTMTPTDIGTVLGFERNSGG